MQVYVLYSQDNLFRSRSPQVYQFSSVQSLSHVQLFQSHGLQQASPPCPSPTPGVFSNLCPLSL